MKIELTNDEASLIIGVIVIWRRLGYDTPYEWKLALQIVDKIFAEDKKIVQDAIRGLS